MFALFLAHFRPILAYHGPISAYSSHFRPILSPLGPIRAFFGLFWPIMGLFQPIPMDFRPISGSLDLDLGHLGPISGVWAWILAILAVSRKFGPRFGAFRVYLGEFWPGFGPFHAPRANILESGPGSGPFRAYFCLFQEFSKSYRDRSRF